MLLTAAGESGDHKHIFLVDDQRLESITYIDFLINYATKSFSDKLILNDKEFSVQLKSKLGMNQSSSLLDRQITPRSTGAVLAKKSNSTTD